MLNDIPEINQVGGWELSIPNEDRFYNLYIDFKTFFAKRKGWEYSPCSKDEWKQEIYKNFTENYADHVERKKLVTCLKTKKRLNIDYSIQLKKDIVHFLTQDFWDKYSLEVKFNNRPKESKSVSEFIIIIKPVKRRTGKKLSSKKETPKQKTKKDRKDNNLVTFNYDTEIQSWHSVYRRFNEADLLEPYLIYLKLRNEFINSGNKSCSIEKINAVPFVMLKFECSKTQAGKIIKSLNTSGFTENKRNTMWGTISLDKIVTSVGLLPGVKHDKDNIIADTFAMLNVKEGMSLGAVLRTEEVRLNIERQTKKIQNLKKQEEYSPLVVDSATDTVKKVLKSKKSKSKQFRKDYSPMVDINEEVSLSVRGLCKLLGYKCVSTMWRKMKECELYGLIQYNSRQSEFITTSSYDVFETVFKNKKEFFFYCNGNIFLKKTNEIIIA